MNRTREAVNTSNNDARTAVEAMTHNGPNVSTNIDDTVVATSNANISSTAEDVRTIKNIQFDLAVNSSSASSANDNTNMVTEEIVTSANTSRDIIDSSIISSIIDTVFGDLNVNTIISECSPDKCTNINPPSVKTHSNEDVDSKSPDVTAAEIIIENQPNSFGVAVTDV